MAISESKHLNCHFFHQCVQCKCWPGFHLKNDGRTCVDVDECSTTLPCSQNCTNTYGSFKCLCVDGYEASRKDPNSCKSLSGKYHLVNSPQNVFQLNLMISGFVNLTIVRLHCINSPLYFSQLKNLFLYLLIFMKSEN